MRCLNRIKLYLVSLFVLLVFFNISRGQSSLQNQAATQEMTHRIEAIVHKAAVPLQLSDSSAPITITSGQIVFSREDVQEVQKYGNRAVPILSPFLVP